MFAGFQLLVFQRQGSLDLPENPLMQKYANRIHNLEMRENLDHISSTEVRQRIRAGQSIDGLVPAEVAAYIMQHNLYKDQPSASSS